VNGWNGEAFDASDEKTCGFTQAEGSTGCPCSQPSTLRAAPLGHARERGGRGAAHVRREHHVGQGGQRAVRGQGFVGHGVEAGGVQLAALQRGDERGLVDDFAARRVDEIAPRGMAANWAAPSIPRVCLFSGTCRLSTSASGSSASTEGSMRTPATGEAPSPMAGSNAATCMPSASPTRATRWPTWPKPTRPSVLPCSSTPSCARDQRPSCSSRSIQPMRRAAASIRPSVISATDCALAPGVTYTGMPRAVAASTSMLLTPTPCLEMTLSVGHAAMALADSCTVREMTASMGSLAISCSTSWALSALSAFVR
jgi:hypothetical protein